MSNFAQVITSFERTGNFPLEANYIFQTVEELKQFYSDEVQAKLVHTGLLKVVEKNEAGLQALYWVVPVEEGFEFKELITGNDIEDIKSKIKDLVDALNTEIANRKAADTKLWGTENPSEDISEDYNSILALSKQLKDTQQKLEQLTGETVSEPDSLKAELQALVGTKEEDIISYLKTLPYSTVTRISKTLDRLIHGPVDKEGNRIESTDINSVIKLFNFVHDFTTDETLLTLFTQLWRNIQGEILPSVQFRTFRGVEDYIIKYRTSNDYKQDTMLEEINHIETGVGLNADGSYSADTETYYLQSATSVMNALRILDKTLHKYVSANTPSVRNEDEAVQLRLTQELDSYVLEAILRLSSQAGNQIIKKTDGLYSYAKTQYENGTLTFIVNDNIVSQHYIGMNAIVQSARYDKTNEQLEFVFKLDSGDTQTVLVPVGALIREWEPYNRPDSAVVLLRTEDHAGTDQLMADVRISTKQWNILEKVDGELYVKGTTDSIYHSGMLLSEYLSGIQTKLGSKFEEIDRKFEEARLDREAIRLELYKAVKIEVDEKLEGHVKVYVTEEGNGHTRVTVVEDDIASGQEVTDLTKRVKKLEDDAEDPSSAWAEPDKDE